MKSWIHQFDVNGHREQLSDWNQINWKKVRKIVNNLRKRIFRARKLGQWKQLRRLQKLLLKSYANLLLAVRQITQQNKGKWKKSSLHKKRPQFERFGDKGIDYVHRKILKSCGLDK